MKNRMFGEGYIKVIFIDWCVQHAMFVDVAFVVRPIAFIGRENHSLMIFTITTKLAKHAESKTAHASILAVEHYWLPPLSLRHLSHKIS